jgi:hypothetical protein
MVKSFFLLLCCWLGLSTICTAQTVFGLKGGPGYADVVSIRNDADTKSGRLSYQAGFLARKQLKERFGVQGELLYLNKGQEGYYVHSLGIPLLAVFRPLEMLELEAGLFPNYSLIAVDGNSNKLTNMWAQPFDVALLAGTRYFISNRLGVNTRLGWGLLNALDSIEYSSENNGLVRVDKSGLRHVNIMLSLEYYF